MDKLMDPRVVYRQALEADLRALGYDDWADKILMQIYEILSEEEAA